MDKETIQAVEELIKILLINIDNAWGGINAIHINRVRRQLSALKSLLECTKKYYHQVPETVTELNRLIGIIEDGGG